MATKYTLSAYGLRIKQRNTRGREKYKNISDFSNGNDLLAIIKTAIHQIDFRQQQGGGIKQWEDDKVIRLSEDCTTGRRYSGMIEAGNYGTVQPIIDVQTGANVGTKQRGHSLTKNFYFRFHIPQNSTLGILLIENIGSSSIFTMLADYLVEYIGNMNFQDLALEIKPLSVQTIVDRWMQEMKSSQITLMGITSNALNLQRTTGIDEGQAQIKTNVCFKVKKGDKIDIDNFFGLLKDQNNKKDRFVLVDGSQCDDIQFEMDLNGSTRKFSMNNVSRLGTKMEITPALQEDGYPSLQTMQAEANEYENLFQQIFDENRYTQPEGRQ